MLFLLKTRRGKYFFQINKVVFFPPTVSMNTYRHRNCTNSYSAELPLYLYIPDEASFGGLGMIKRNGPNKFALHFGPHHQYVHHAPVRKVK